MAVYDKTGLLIDNERVQALAAGRYKGWQKSAGAPFAMQARRFLLSCSAATMLMSSGAAFAQAATEGEQDEILITGRLEEALPLELSSQGNRVQVIDSSAIQAAGFSDSTQVLQMLATSIAMAPRGGAFDYSEISFQGSRSNEILWMVDGVRLNNRLYNTITPLDTIPAHMIERIEVLEGGQSLFYGSQAVAGAVNIVTKSFSNTTDGQMSISGDTIGAKSLNGYVRTAFGPHKVVLFASSDKSPGYEHIMAADIQPSTTNRKRGYDVFTVGAKYSIDLSSALTFTASYEHAEAELEFIYPNLHRDSFNRRNEEIASAKLDIDLGESVKIFLKGYYHRWDSTFTQINNVLGNPSARVVYYDETPWYFEDKGINVLAKLSPVKGFEFYAGYDLQKYKGADQVVIILPTTETVHAVFGQVRTTSDLIEDLKLSVGVRANFQQNNQTEVIWTATGQYDFPNEMFIKANVGTAFRLPDTYELFGVDLCCELGNPNLKPERSQNFNASIGGPLPVGLPGSTWELIGFYREVSNLIDADIDANGDLRWLNTAGKTKVKGGEVAFHANILDGLSANLSYIYTEAKLNASGLQINYIPKHTGKFGLSYLPRNSRFGATLSGYYYGTAYQTVGRVGRLPYGDYLTVDASVFYDLDEDGHHRVTARVSNAFDANYVSRYVRGNRDSDNSFFAARYRGQPQTFQLKYTYSF
jgi:outer membrane cobalamin receptor